METDRIVRVPSGDGAFVLRADSRSGAILGVYTPGLGFQPSRMQPRLVRVDEPPEGTDEARWDAVRLGVLAQLRAAEREWRRKSALRCG